MSAAQNRTLPLLAAVAASIIMCIPVSAQQEAFEPLELDLDAAVEMALQQNYSLKMATAAMEEAQAAIGEAGAAKRLQVDLEGNYTRMGPSSTTEFPGPGGQTTEVQLSPDDTHSYGVSAYQSLYSSGRNDLQVALAELNLTSAEFDRMIARRQIILAVKQAYFGVLRARGFVDVSEQAVEAARQHWENAVARYEAGTVPRLDVIRAEVDVANAEQELIAAQTQVDNARASLKKILAVDVTRPVKLAEMPDVELLTVDAQKAIDMSYDNREELKQARTRVKLAETSERLAKSQRGFDIGLAGNYDRQSASGLGGTDYSWAVSVVLSKPLSDGGLSAARERQARKQQEQAQLAMQQIRDEIATEVWQSYLDLQDAKSRLTSTQKTIESAQETLRLSEVRYNAGIATPVEVTDARVALTLARTNHVEAIYRYRTAEAKLLSAVNVSRETLAGTEPGSEAE
ncbi:MAG: TolC family protein [Armatimonadota bacterium]